MLIQKTVQFSKNIKIKKLIWKMMPFDFDGDSDKEEIPF